MLNPMRTLDYLNNLEDCVLIFKDSSGSVYEYKKYLRILVNASSVTLDADNMLSCTYSYEKINNLKNLESLIWFSSK